MGRAFRGHRGEAGEMTGPRMASFVDGRMSRIPVAAGLGRGVGALAGGGPGRKGGSNGARLAMRTNGSRRL